MNPKRIVVRAPNWIGDQVMARDFYRGLRDAYPGAHLALLGKPAVLDVVEEALFDVILPLQGARALRAKQYELGITLPASYSAAWLFVRSSIPVRVGFAQGGSDLLLTDHLPWKGRSSAKHKSELYLDLLEWLTGKKRSPRAGSAGDDGATSSPAKHAKRAERGDLRTIVVAPGASLPLREWPYYQELLIELRKIYPDRKILVVGSRAEAKWHGFLKRLNLDGVEDWVEKTGLPELVELCERAGVVIANDSGVAHVSATLAGAPTAVVFGPGDPRYVLPAGNRVAAARVELGCSPCEKAFCRRPFGYQQCLKSLSVETVLRTVASVL